MAYVYGRSHINLAATTSADADSGLFSERDPILINGCRGIFLRNEAKEYILTSKSDWHDQAERGLLHVRGWVFQERLLAPQTLHFTSSQLFWECRELISSEEFPSEIPHYKSTSLFGDQPSKILLQRLQKLMKTLWKFRRCTPPGTPF
ncbi:hypothetical protein GQ53DRAFT_865668 [Thozetella sp. PMI_491]|nr:hypothetical protein GQ53DRAFT_865668 [Thozetella sp. PMI_491]